MSATSRQRLVDLGLHPERVHVVAYGVDFPVSPPEHMAREQVLCLAVGRMVTRKAPILTLDAFRRAADRVSELRLDYVGTGPLLAAARHFVDAFGLAGKVAFHDTAGDAVAMGDRIVSLAREGALRRQMGKAGWDRAKALFAWSRERHHLCGLMELA